LTNWAQRITAAQEPVTASESFGGLQMIRRNAIEQLQPLVGRLSSPAAALHRSAHHPQTSPSQPNIADAITAHVNLAEANIEISHISHQQLASPKLVEARRRSHTEV
jgi:hypothetical protein